MIVRTDRTKKWQRQLRARGQAGLMAMLYDKHARLKRRQRDKKSRGLTKSIPLARRKALRARAKEIAARKAGLQ